MRRLSKVAILGLVATAIGGELFAPAIPLEAQESRGRESFITASRTAIQREWTDKEKADFHSTHLIPDAIKSQLTATQIDEFFGGHDTPAARKYQEALEKLAGK